MRKVSLALADPRRSCRCFNGTAHYWTVSTNVQPRFQTGPETALPANKITYRNSLGAKVDRCEFSAALGKKRMNINFWSESTPPVQDVAMFYHHVTVILLEGSSLPAPFPSCYIKVSWIRSLAMANRKFRKGKRWSSLRAVPHVIKYSALLKTGFPETWAGPECQVRTIGAVVQLLLGCPFPSVSPRRGMGRGREGAQEFLSRTRTLWLLTSRNNEKKGDGLGPRQIS